MPLSSFGPTYNFSCDYDNTDQAIKATRDGSLYDPYKALLHDIRDKKCVFSFGKTSVGKSNLANALYSGHHTICDQKAVDVASGK